MFSRSASSQCASLRAALPIFQSRISCKPAVFRRSLVYVKTPSGSQKKVVGFKKNPEDYLSVNGTLYPGTADTLKTAKDFLGQEYPLSDDLILQALTHKSFAHGLKPYNENMSIIGRHFLRLQTLIHATSQKSENPTVLNGVNFDVSIAKISNLLSATAITSKVCVDTGISKSIFWKAPNEVCAPPVCSKYNMLTNLRTSELILSTQRL